MEKKKDSSHVIELKNTTRHIFLNLSSGDVLDSTKRCWGCPTPS